VVVVCKPQQGEILPADAQVCVIPRDVVPEKGLSAAVAAATYPLPRAHFTKEGWTLEPPEVVALLAKISRNGTPLTEYAGIKPLRGIMTGFNEAFVIDTSTRDLADGQPVELAGLSRIFSLHGFYTPVYTFRVWLWVNDGKRLWTQIGGKPRPFKGFTDNRG
jgi:hypothetical protein